MEGSIQVFLKDICGKTYSPTLATSATVLALKELFSDQDGTPIAMQRLIFGGRVLEDSQTLGAAGLKNGSVVHVVRKLGGGGTMTTTGTDLRSGGKEYRLGKGNQWMAVELGLALKMRCSKGQYCDTKTTGNVFYFNKGMGHFDLSRGFASQCPMCDGTENTLETFGFCGVCEFDIVAVEVDKEDTPVHVSGEVEEGKFYQFEESPSGTTTTWKSLIVRAYESTDPCYTQVNTDPCLSE